MIVSQLQKLCNEVETDKERLRMGIVVPYAYQLVYHVCAIILCHGIVGRLGLFPVATAIMYFMAVAAVLIYYTWHQLKDII